MTRYICFPDDINWFPFKRNLCNFGRKMIKLKCIFFCHQMVSRGIHIGYNKQLVRFYFDYFDRFGKLRDIYFAYRCQKAKIMPSFDKTGVAQIAPDWGAQNAPIFFRGHNIDLLLTIRT